VDYYTDADLNVSLSLLDVELQGDNAAYGEVKVTTLVKLFKKMKLDTGESLGYGPVRLPDTDMHTQAMWLTLSPEEAGQYPKDSLQNGMMGICNTLRIVLPLYLMCSPRDIAVSYQVKSPMTDRPTIIVYDTSPGGVGLAEKAYHMRGTLLAHARQLIQGCDCEQGCPSCVGPVGEVGEDGKAMALQLLEVLRAHAQ